jgi:mono/diheme cytochrome c family protein
MSKAGRSLVITAVTVLCAAAFKIGAAGVVVGPALAADASNGMRVAELWCAACHVVTVSQRQANADAPPFEEIAKRPNFSEPGLVTFLLDPHAKMPNMNLTRIEANDIAAYIGTLR